MITRTDVVNFAAKSAVGRKVASQRGQVTRRRRQWQSVMGEREALLKSTQHKNLAAVADSHFEDLHGRVKAEIQLAAYRLNNGELAPEDFQKAVRASLRSGYDKAAQLGKIKAKGIVASLTASELRAVDRERYTDHKYLQGFVDDIQGKYSLLTPAERAARIEWRSQMYADALQGTMNNSFVAQLPEGAMVRWRLGAHEHCSTCLSEAAKGERKRSTLTRVPGDGSTKCKCITTPGSRVLCRRGWIPISEVLVGDYVFTHLGRWKRVIETPRHKAFGEFGVNYLADNGYVVGFTDDHKLMTGEGWQPIVDIDKHELSVYTIQYEETMYPVQKTNAVRPKRGLVQRVCKRVSLWLTQGFSGCGMRLLWAQSQGDTTMANPESNHQRRTQEGWDSTTNTILRSYRRLIQYIEGRWPSICSILGRARARPLRLSLPMGMDSSQWVNTCGICNTSQGRGQVKRYTVKPGMYEGRNTRQTAHDTRASASYGRSQRRKADRQDPICLPEVWDGILQTPEARPPKQILFTGMLPNSKTLYDLTVEDDHSFIVEGIVAHNSNCGCSLETITTREVTRDTQTGVKTVEVKATLTGAPPVPPSVYQPKEEVV